MTLLLLLVLVAPLHTNAQTTPPSEQSEALNFEAAFDKIMGRNLTVQSQKASLEAARAKNISTSLRYLPTIDAEAKHLTTKSGGATGDRNTLGATARLNLFKFGADSASINAAERDIEAEEFRLAQAFLTAEFEAISSLVDAIAARSEFNIVEQILKTRRDSLDIARKRYQRGLLAQEEVQKIEVDVSNAEAQLNDTRAKIIRTEGELLRLLGGEKVEAVWPWKNHFENSIPHWLSKSDISLSDRPDWAAANADFYAASERADSAWGTIFPSLDASLSWNYFDSNLAGAKTSGTEVAGAISLTIPLFDRLSNYSNYQVQTQLKTSAEISLENTKRTATSQWEASRRALKVAYSTAIAREKNVESSRKLYQANLRRFNKGIVNANELIIDQDRLFRSEQFAISGWAEVHKNFTRMCHSAGVRIKGCLDDKN